MTKLAAVLLGLILAGLLMLGGSAALFRRRRVFSGLLCGVFALFLLLLPVGIGLVAGNMVTYTRLTHEERALKAEFTQTGEHQFDAVLTFPSGDVQRLVLRGDEWQVDARIVKWKPLANIVGFDAAYRLERITGRYSAIADERSAPHTVYALSPATRLDVWSVVRHLSAWLPWFDALYGSAVYVPMADGASYAVLATQAGLIVRPLNAAAGSAVGGWH
ncbi:MAG: hypothetical protein JSR36_08295 [Proteobacteria bacterium]|nr:hypothetical protein [Pseudomonadota bacterium]